MNKIEERNKKRIEKRRARIQKEKEKAKKPKVNFKEVIKDKIMNLDYKKIALFSALGIVIIVAGILFFNTINEKKQFNQIQKIFDDNGYAVSFTVGESNRYNKDVKCVTTKGTVVGCGEETYVAKQKENIFIDIVNKEDTNKIFSILINEETKEELTSYSLTLNPESNKGKIIYQYAWSSDGKTKYGYKNYYEYIDAIDDYATDATSCYYVISANSKLHKNFKTTCKNSDIEDIKSQVIQPANEIIASLTLSNDDFFTFGSQYYKTYVNPFIKQLQDGTSNKTDDDIKKSISKKGYTISTEENEYFKTVTLSGNNQQFIFNKGSNESIIYVSYKNNNYSNLQYEYMPFSGSAIVYKDNIAEDCITVTNNEIVETNQHNTCSTTEMANAKKMHNEYKKLLKDLDISYARLEKFILAQIK